MTHSRVPIVNAIRKQAQKWKQSPPWAKKMHFGTKNVIHQKTNSEPSYFSQVDISERESNENDKNSRNVTNKQLKNIPVDVYLTKHSFSDGGNVAEGRHCSLSF